MTIEQRRRAKPAVRLTDSTLRDGSHAVRHQFTEQDVVRDRPARWTRPGLQVIEVTHGDGLSGSTFNYGFGRADRRASWSRPRSRPCERAKIAVLVLPGLGTVREPARGARCRRAGRQGRDALDRGGRRRSSTSAPPASWAWRPSAS